MEITVKHTTETISGKTYPLTITRYKGRQEIETHRGPMLVDELAVFESPLGTSRVFTPARLTEPTEAERMANRAHIIQVAQEVMRRNQLAARAAAAEAGT